MSVRLDTDNPKLYQELLNRYDTWMFDCDGVLWRGDRLRLCSRGPPDSTQPEYVTVTSSAGSIRTQSRSLRLDLPHPLDLIIRFFAEKRVRFVTNNASTSRRNYKKFDGLGIEAQVVRISAQFDVSGSSLLLNIPVCLCDTRRAKSLGQHMRLLFTSLRHSSFPWIRRCV
jgi:hypothetical protein